MQSYQMTFSSLPTLTTERLTLRKLRLSDARDLFSYASDPEVARHVLWETHKNLSQSRRFLWGAIRQYHKGLPASYGIVLNKDGKMIGTIGFMWVNTDHKSAEIGYSLSREYWNQGIMTEALKELIRFGFEDLLLNRIEAQHELDNPASGRVMIKSGMTKEGVMRQRLINKGKKVDVAVYAILQSEWRAHKGHKTM